MKCLVFVVCIIGSLIDIGLSASNSEKDAVSDYRLSTDVEPINYVIEVTPYLINNDSGKLFTFDGSVTINLKANVTEVKTITIQYNDLNIVEKSLVANGPTSIDQPEGGTSNQYEDDIIEGADYNSTTNKYTITLTQALELGKTYDLKLNFTGKLRTDMVGFYRSSYKEGNETRYAFGWNDLIRMK